jgi:hypothetical protein
MASLTLMKADENTIHQDHNHLTKSTMKVKELIEKLQKMDQNALVFVNVDEVTGVEEVLAKIHDGYFGKQFSYSSSPGRGKKAVTFTHLHEISTGEVVPSTSWYFH